MYGLQIAFKDFMSLEGISGSPWVGMKHFKRFFESYHFWRLIRNTFGISLYTLAVSFPLPIIFAIMLNEVRKKWYKKTIQLITYAPHFISTVVMVGMLILFLSPRNGIVNELVKLFGGDPIHFMTVPESFKTIYVLSHVWQQTGWNAIIYLAALSSVDPGLYEAARMDGATKMQKIWHIDLPAIMPTAVILLILNSGNIMNVGFEKIYLMQNPLNLSSSEVISTYVYKVGLTNSEFSFGSAVGLFNSIINLVLLVFVNKIANKLGREGLW